MQFAHSSVQYPQPQQPPLLQHPQPQQSPPMVQPDMSRNSYLEGGELSLSRVSILRGGPYFLSFCTTDVRKLIYVRLGNTVVDVSHYKYKQDLKNIKNVKRCRDGMPKSMQTR